MTITARRRERPWLLPTQECFPYGLDMAELGETIKPPDFVEDDVHSEKTCPWHDNTTPPTQAEMDAQADDEDAGAGQVLAPIPANSGKKLGGNMGGKADTKIRVSYPGESKPKEEDLQWAPHHLIPGNASLKGSAIVPYLGDDTVIKKYGKGSKIKKGQTVGYDVNCAENGVWLPSPYALSMKGKWPTSPAAKLAYVVAAIDQNGGKAQFHMCHGQYSVQVQGALDKIAAKLKLITTSGRCPVADSKKDDKFDAPRALVSRLHQLSGQLRRLVNGPVWRPPMFTDETLMAAYIAHKKMNPIAGKTGDLQPIKLGTK